MFTLVILLSKKKIISENIYIIYNKSSYFWTSLSIKQSNV